MRVSEATRVLHLLLTLHNATTSRVIVLTLQLFPYLILREGISPWIFNNGTFSTSNSSSTRRPISLLLGFYYLVYTPHDKQHGHSTPEAWIEAQHGHSLPEACAEAKHGHSAPKACAEAYNGTQAHHGYFTREACVQV